MGAEARQFLDRRGAESEWVAIEFFRHASALGVSGSDALKINISCGKGALEVARQIAVILLESRSG
jgi:hypothetical protein